MRDLFYDGLLLFLGCSVLTLFLKYIINLMVFLKRISLFVVDNKVNSGHKEVSSARILDVT